MAVGVHCLQLQPLAQHPPRPAGGETGQPRAVRRLVPGRDHQIGEVTTTHLRLIMAERGLRGLAQGSGGSSGHQPETCAAVSSFSSLPLFAQLPSQATP